MSNYKMKTSAFLWCFPPATHLASILFPRSAQQNGAQDFCFTLLGYGKSKTCINAGERREGKGAAGEGMRAKQKPKHSNNFDMLPYLVRVSLQMNKKVTMKTVFTATYFDSPENQISSLSGYSKQEDVTGSNGQPAAHSDQRWLDEWGPRGCLSLSLVAQNWFRQDCLWG